MMPVTAKGRENGCSVRNGPTKVGPYETGGPTKQG